MKKIQLSIIATLAMGIATTSSATSLNEALTNGKVSGEVTATYEKRDFNQESNAYYSNTAYSVGSFALKYETAVWNNLQLTSKFRAYGTIYEDDDDSITGTGTGDASERFKEKNGTNNSVDLENMFLQYNTDVVTVTAGRQAIRTDWINQLHDAIKIDANFKNTSIEAIWSLRQGRVYAREYFPMTKINEDKGVYKLGLTQKYDNISVTAYALVMPDVKDIFGAKTNLKIDDTTIRAQYAISQDDADSDKDSSVIDLKVATTLSGFNPFIGLIKVDSDADFPGYSQGSGETIVPFEEGDYIYKKDAQTIYAGVSKTFGDLSATLLYGNTKYDQGAESLTLNETTIWAGYKIVDNLTTNVGLTHVDEDNKSTVSDYDQINLTVTYSF